MLAPEIASVPSAQPDRPAKMPRSDFPLLVKKCVPLPPAHRCTPDALPPLAG
jgi:hypothetical protein